MVSSLCCIIIVKPRLASIITPVLTSRLYDTVEYTPIFVFLFHFYKPIWRLFRGLTPAHQDHFIDNPVVPFFVIAVILNSGETSGKPRSLGRHPLPRPGRLCDQSSETLPGVDVPAQLGCEFGNPRTSQRGSPDAYLPSYGSVFCTSPLLVYQSFSETILT